MLEKFGRFNESLGGWAEKVGLAALVFMVALTCVDVLSAKLFLRPVPGSLDMMMLAQLVGVSFAAAGTMIQRRHVCVDFFVALFPERPRAIMESVVALLGLVLFVIVVWRLFAHGLELQSSHEVTPTAAIPMGPFTYAAALAIVPLCLVLLQQFLQSLLRAVRH